MLLVVVGKGTKFQLIECMIVRRFDANPGFLKAAMLGYVYERLNHLECRFLSESSKGCDYASRTSIVQSDHFDYRIQSDLMFRQRMLFEVNSQCEICDMSEVVCQRMNRQRARNDVCFNFHKTIVKLDSILGLGWPSDLVNTFVW